MTWSRCPDDEETGVDDAPWGWRMVLGAALILLPVVLGLALIVWWLAGWWPWLGP